MDKNDLSRLQEGAQAVGVSLPEAVAQTLLRLRDELLRWNARVNLTAITEPGEVLEKHLVDSLSVVPWIAEGASVLDVGAGAGFPGLVLAAARPDVSVTLVDAVAKKVAFIKSAAAQLGLAPRARGLHLRLTGAAVPSFGPFDVAVARALTNLPDWLQLAPPYLKAEGLALAMLGEGPDDVECARVAQAAGLSFDRAKRFTLPWSGGRRMLAGFRTSCYRV